MKTFAVEQHERATQRQAEAAAVQHWARLLGYAGLVPFLPAFALLWLQPGDAQLWVQKSLLAYAGVILSFVGALHWTTGLQARDRQIAAARLCFSVAPALIAWIALLAPPVTGFSLMISGFAVAYLVDQRLWSRQPWFLRLRGHLSAGATMGLSLGLLSVLGLI